MKRKQLDGMGARARGLGRALAMATLLVAPLSPGLAEVAQAPLFVATQVPGNLALVPSVEFPTVNSIANLGNYDINEPYAGYFDSGKCYIYQHDLVEANRHFYPVRFTTDRRCTGTDEWSGHFLNWAATQTIDPFRAALTGGYRVRDTVTETWLEKARHDRNSGFAQRNLSGSTTVQGATPFSASSFRVRIAGLDNKMRFRVGSTDNIGDTSPTVFQNQSTNNTTIYELSVRVKVCVPGLLEPNCRQYGSNWKPEGLIQQYADEVRYSVFGYLNDHNIRRDGGVLRARKKYVGPVRFTDQRLEEDNPNKEWDPNTGILFTNPDPLDAASTALAFNTTVLNSGVINYINKFGQLTTNNHKSFDPVGELYYAAIRYLKNQGNVSSYSTPTPDHASSPNNATRAQWVDGFPVIDFQADVDDPMQFSCQKNVILGIGDTNTHADRNLPGGVRSNNEPALPTEVSADNTVNVRTATERVQLIENNESGVNANLQAGTTNQFGSCCNNNSAYMAGLAYDSLTRDIRPDLPGVQNITTHWVDVRENGVLRNRTTNQYWLAAKYGGFEVPEGFQPYQRSTHLPLGWWSDGDLLETGDPRPRNFYVASDATRMVESLTQAFQSIITAVQASSSSIAANSTRLDTGTLIYQASFNASDWSGRLVAYSLNPDGSIFEPIWDTHDPDNTGVQGIPAHTSRTVFTAVGSQNSRSTTGLNFSAGAMHNLSAQQRAFLEAGDGWTVAQQRLNWLRGDQSLEGAGGFRQRQHLLGDIVNSDPYFSGSRDDFGFVSLPEGGEAYDLFLASNRQNDHNMLYVGSNGGMLHGFDALTGEEKFAYVPIGVYPHLASLTSQAYQHRYFVDGSPRVSHAFVDNAWRSVLVGATGAGGRSIFALDVTNPDNMGPEKLLWEIEGRVVDGNTTRNIGITLSQPVIARVSGNQADNRWVAIFGSGYGTGQTPRLIIVSLRTGTVIRTIAIPDTAAGNALGSVVPVDVNNDRITDYVYAGDLRGNMWRFDLTGNSNQWSVGKLFQAEDDDGQRQPITMRPVVGNHPKGGVMVYFGTGKYFEVGDGIVEPEPQIQSFYGIRDEGGTVLRSQLQQQEIIFEGFGTLVQENVSEGIAAELTDFQVRVTSDNGVNYPTQKGWYMNLIPPGTSFGQGERAVSMPILRFGRLIFTTIIPTANPCDFGGISWLMEVDAVTGNRFDYSVFDLNNDGFVDGVDFIYLADGTRVPVSGKRFDEMVKTPGIVSAGEVEYKYTSGSSGSIGVTREKGAGDILGRQSWRQLQ